MRWSRLPPSTCRWRSGEPDPDRRARPGRSAGSPGRRAAGRRRRAPRRATRPLTSPRTACSRPSSPKTAWSYPPFEPGSGRELSGRQFGVKYPFVNCDYGHLAHRLRRLRLPDDLPGLFPGSYSCPTSWSRSACPSWSNSMVRWRGGIAPNIAYTLALLGEHPRLWAAVGEDFEEYRAWLESKGHRYLRRAGDPRCVHRLVFRQHRPRQCPDRQLLPGRDGVCRPAFAARAGSATRPTWW